MALYIFYVFTTISLSAKDEVVHLDPLMHEVGVPELLLHA